MKYNKSNIIGDAGEHLLAARIIKLFGYPCRLSNIDIGIDAEIELIDSNYKSTGQFIKCQIKTSTSQKNYEYINGEHIAYWNSMNIPVVVFLVKINSEEILLHVVKNIDDYKKSKSGYKIEFSTSNKLLKSKKKDFDKIAIYPIEQKIIELLEDSVSIVNSDNENWIIPMQHDLTSFEFIFYNFNEVKTKLNKAKELMSKDARLQEYTSKYSKELIIISEYFSWVEEQYDSIILDHGEDKFSHIKNVEFDWYSFYEKRD